jgi:hypothetical protein
MTWKKREEFIKKKEDKKMSICRGCFKRMKLIKLARGKTLRKNSWMILKVNSYILKCRHNKQKIVFKKQRSVKLVPRSL